MKAARTGKRKPLSPQYKDLRALDRQAHTMCGQQGFHGDCLLSPQRGPDDDFFDAAIIGMKSSIVDDDFVEQTSPVRNKSGW
ncbi:MULTISPECIES: hypothetical protein [unclassified Bradyrhizobium]|uniref:hypothetical protein n=1 Tax=unclassified Bradyrhizobium TaxID=2631580 RepID=UPI001FF8E74E|nr:MULTISPECIES: hypothetical protein [unclassified Bradyrhizobium]MCK1540269.1 hypothetical protein [Bradyrhizobium sp. 176]MCK1554837.1 hypothetical protein [Bradyrhizobium sp. 171]